MKKKCDKYESLFIFSDEKTLKEHIEYCDDCKKEYETMEKVSQLIQEVKPHYKNNSRYNYKYQVLQAACLLFLFVVSGVSMNILDMRYGLLDTVKYGRQLTVTDLGFPTDDYGLIQVDDE